MILLHRNFPLVFFHRFLFPAPFLWFDIKTRYNGSIYKALVASFASHEWMPWRFQAEKVPPGYWTDKSARRRYFDWLQVKLEFNSMEDWYKITKAVIRKNGGSGMLMHYYQDNVREFVMDVCPEYDWKVWKFARSPTTWTRNQLLHKEWFESAAERLGFTTLDAWYNISTPQLASLVGEDPVTPHYGHSLPKALRRCYPDHNWQDWRFRNMNRASLVGQKRLLEHAAASAWGWDNTGDHLDRWYRIKFSDLVRAGLSGLITGRYNSSLVSALRAIYPNHQWDEWRFEKVANRNTISPQDSDETSR
jgi:hypothetical protein